MIESSGSGYNKNYFEKVLTPSDVENLQLVIPNNDAENYFPPFQDKREDMILPFRDRNRKMWWFSYSYWDCIQIYTLTKGWDDFVKEKKLKAGDTVSFHRGYIPRDNEPEKEVGIFLIDWWIQVDVDIGSSGGSGNNKNYFNSEKEKHMFDKVLTPTDVVPFRLAIPTNYVKEYFPQLQDGMMLDFQDRNGKMWRFCYNQKYYGITKAWIDFVYEKKLIAGDTVSFYRDHIPRDNEPEKQVEIFFIDWKYQVDVAGGSSPPSPPSPSLPPSELKLFGVVIKVSPSGSKDKES